MNKHSLFICSALLACAAVLAAMPALNLALFNAINRAYPSPILWMTITNMGNVVFLGCALFIALRRNIQLLSNALLCAVILHFSVKFGKAYGAVLRPEHLPDMPNLILLGPPLALSDYAMPSGHTTSAFMAAIFVAKAYRLRGWRLAALLGYAMLVGISRIAVGAHWPADIFAGAALGIIAAQLCTLPQLRFQHPSLSYICALLYLPFVGFALSHITRITHLTSVINEGIFVAAGIVALGYWGVFVKREIIRRYL